MACRAVGRQKFCSDNSNNMDKARQGQIAAGVLMVLMAAGALGVLIYLLSTGRRIPLGPAPPVPTNPPAAPANSIVDATAFGALRDRAPDDPATPTTPDGADYTCQPPKPSAVGAATTTCASCPTVTAACPCQEDACTAAGCLADPAPAAGCPDKPRSYQDPGLHPFVAEKDATPYGYCTGVPGTTNEVVYKNWVDFYDDPTKTGQTFVRDPDRVYNRVGNITGAGCFVSGDKKVTNHNYSRGPYMQNVYVGDEAVLYDMLTRTYPATVPGFPRLTPVPTPRGAGSHAPSCCATADCADPAATCVPGAPGDTSCDGQPGGSCQIECQKSGDCVNSGTECVRDTPKARRGVCACRPPCDSVPCDPECRPLLAPVAEVPIGNATFDVAGGYAAHVTGVHKIWGHTQSFEHGGVNAGNVYPWKPQNVQGTKCRPTLINPGDPMYNVAVLRHRLTGDFAPPHDPSQARDCSSAPVVPNALNWYKRWNRPPGYESETTANYLKKKAECGQCTADGEKCFNEIQCLRIPSFDDGDALTLPRSADSNETLESFYTTPPQKPVDASCNPPDDKGARKSYPDGAYGPNPRARCGGCCATQQLFGPGRYTARARIIPTEPQSAALLDMTDPTNPLGRGGVFAMWTFAYSEVYAIGADPAEGPFVPSDQATTSTNCWDDCSCLADTNYCHFQGAAAKVNTCCDPRTAKKIGCAAPHSFKQASPGTSSFYNDPDTVIDPKNPGAGIKTAQVCTLGHDAELGSAPHDKTTGGSCMIANEDLAEWDATVKAGLAGVGAEKIDLNCYSKDPPLPGDKTTPWNNAGKCMQNVNTLQGGVSQPYALGQVPADYKLKINGRTPPKTDYTVVCSGYKVYTSINSEIDIEIPSNSPQLDWGSQLTYSTMNANTWAFDIDSYQGYKPLYSQALVQATVPRSLADPTPRPPTFVDGNYHDYMIDWYVDQDHSKSYVAFYFDGKLVYSTKRFVPTRTGRLIFGLWPGWWGTGRQRPDFDFMFCDLAGLIVEPYTQVNAPDVKIRTMAQTYDQVLPPGVEQTECCPFSTVEYDYTPGAESQCSIERPCEIACDYRAIPASQLPAAKYPAKIYAAVNNRCQQVTASTTGEIFPGDPYCGGKYGTCVGCQAPPPQPGDPTYETSTFKLAGEIVLLFAVCVGAVVGGVLLGMKRNR